MLTPPLPLLLIARSLGSGILAFTLNETNPKTRPPPGYTLRELISWKLERSRPPRPPRLSREATTADDSLDLNKELGDAQKLVSDVQKAV